MLTTLGFILLIVVPEGAGILAGIFLAIVGPQYTVYLSLASINIAGYTKKTFYIGVTTITYCVGNISGPLLIREEFAPRYTPAMIAMIAGMVLASFLFLYLRWTFTRDNQYRQQLMGSNKLPLEPPKDVKETDLTDKTNLYFVYHR